MRQIPFVGTPISLRDLRFWLYKAAISSDIVEDFKKSICIKYKSKYCFFLSSGRAALYLLLQSLRKISQSDKNEVIIPSYNCFSVSSSIVKAGLKIRICDINVNTLDYDYQKLSRIDFQKVLCILSANLFGIPNDLVRLQQFAENHGVYLIDDAAQCMEGKVNNIFSGTFGDAGFYSLGLSKNITSVEGGIIVTNSDEIAALIESEVDKLPSPSMLKNISYIIKMFSYSLFLHPRLWWIPANFPLLNLNYNIFSTDFTFTSYNKLLGAMGFQLFKKIDKITDIRIRNARYLMENLDNLPFISHIKHAMYSNPVYLRFPILISNRKIRDSIINSLVKKGIDVVRIYSSSMRDLPEMKRFIVNYDEKDEGGSLAISQIVTLPTHPYVTRNDLDIMISTIKSIVKQ